MTCNVCVSLPSFQNFSALYPAMLASQIVLCFFKLPAAFEPILLVWLALQTGRIAIEYVMGVHALMVFSQMIELSGVARVNWIHSLLPGSRARLAKWYSVPLVLEHVTVRRFLRWRGQSFKPANGQLFCCLQLHTTHFHRSSWILRREEFIYQLACCTGHGKGTAQHNCNVVIVQE